MEFGYDVRRAAAGYAAVVGAAGGFVVPAVVLVFTVAGVQSHRHPVEIALTTGLLVVGLVGCLAGAFALASLSGEPKLTANLPAAAMHISQGVLVAVVAIMGAFETLSAVYLPESKILFAGITAGTAVAGASFNALSVADAWAVGPDDDEWRSARWLKSRGQAYRWAYALAVVSSVTVAVGFGAYAADERLVLSTGGANLLVASGIVIVLASVLVGVFRTGLSRNGDERAMGRRETLVGQAIVSVYVAILIAALP